MSFKKPRWVSVECAQGHRPKRGRGYLLKREGDSREITCFRTCDQTKLFAQMFVKVIVNFVTRITKTAQAGGAAHLCKLK